MRKTKISTILLSVASLALLASCSNQGGDDSTGGSGNNSGVTLGPSIENLSDDIQRDSDGNVVFQNVELDMMSVIGAPDNAVLNGLIDQFNTTYEGQIHINVNETGQNDYYTSLTQTMESDPESLPDITLMHDHKYSEYAYKNLFYPLEDIFAKSSSSIDWDDLYSNMATTVTIGQKHYGLPLDGHGTIMIYRQDIIAKNQLNVTDGVEWKDSEGNPRYVPQGRDEFRSMLQKAQDMKNAGTLQTRNLQEGGTSAAWTTANKQTFHPTYWLAMGGNEDGFTMSALYNNNATISSVENGGRTVSFAENAGLKSYMSWMLGMANEGMMGDTSDYKSDFLTGDTIVAGEGPWNISTYTAATGTDWASDDSEKNVIGIGNYGGFLTLPENDNGANANKWYGTGHAFGITSHVTSWTKALAASEFMSWLISPQHLAEWSKGGHAPAWKSAYESDIYKKVLNTKDATGATLRGIGDPSNIMTLEPIRYPSTVQNGYCDGVIQNVVGGNMNGIIDTVKYKNLSEDELKAKLDEAVTSLKGVEENINLSLAGFNWD